MEGHSEHVPNPHPWEDWTQEDQVKFQMFSSVCPMCQYKFKYATIARLIEAASETQDEQIMQTMVPIINQKQTELMELGLFIATTVDNANEMAGNAGHN